MPEIHLAEFALGTITAILLWWAFLQIGRVKAIWARRDTSEQDEDIKYREQEEQEACMHSDQQSLH